MEDIKAKLKVAREAIKNKDYQTSFNLAKEILKADKDNYMALIFMGLSLQEVGPSDQASQVFRKAIEINPSNSLAWNGLINFFEKIESSGAKQELIKLYSSAISIERTEKRTIEYCEKLAKLYEYGDIKEIMETIYNCRKSEHIQNKTSFYEILVNLCQQIKDFPSELDDVYEECLSYLIENETPKSEYYSAYLALLYNKREYDNLLNHAEQMFYLFTTETSSLVWICEVFNQYFVEDPEQAKNIFKIVTKYYSKLLEIEPQNVTGLFSKSIVFLGEEEFIKSKDLLIKVVSLRPGLIQAWVLLTNVYIKLNLWEDAVESSLMARKLLKSLNNSDKILKEILDVLTVEVLSKSSKKNDWQEALNLYQNIENTERKKNCMEFIIRIKINLRKLEEANLLISELKYTEEAKFRLLLAQLFHKQEMYQEALNLLENDIVNKSDWWIEIGLLYWDKEEYEKCLFPFLKAVKCDPNNFLAFLYLANYYKKTEDLNKARRCYEKALKINSKSPQIGTELCKIYRKLKNWEATHSLLQNITSGTMNEKNSWAWLQLGLNNLEQEDYANAIDNLQFVIRIQPKNVHCWEALADAYFMRGSYTSAQKCYEKSLELVNNTLYPLLQIANIKKILGHYAEARTYFEFILLSNSYYVPALKGLAETCMYQAKECFKDQRLGTSRDHAQVALEKLILAIHQRNELSCLWKMLADCCLFVAKFPEKYCCMHIPTFFVECKELDETSILIAECQDLFDVATRSYCKAINLIEDNILIWHDLAVCYLYHAISTSNEENEQLFSYAMAVSYYCTSNNPSNWQHWNLLGMVAMKKNTPNYTLAQHAFIKAVTVDRDSAVSWTNLGILYILMDDIKLANKAFAEGQRSDTNYVNSWIGQAFIAEIMGREEAMDLFRHSTQLNQQQQGGLGYGNWVCRTLLRSSPDANIYSIHNMHAISIAFDALNWYTEKNPNDGCAWNMLGILSERMGLKETSLRSYKNAYRLSKKEYGDLVATNYGRALTKLEKYSEAIKIFQEIKEATFNSGSGLALALFKDKQYEESYDAYDQALHWLSQDQCFQSDLLVALASMAYMFQGISASKTLLFQSIQLKPPSPWSLYATLSLALLHEDLKLAKLVSDELKVIKNKKSCLKHYALLRSYTYLLEGNQDMAMSEVSKLIHRYPDNPSVWLTLSLLLLRMSHGKENTYIAAKCAQAAMTFGQTNMDVTKVLCLVSLASSLAGNSHSALISAQKAVHFYPNVAEGWAILISALSSIKEKYRVDKLLPAVCLHVEELNPTVNLLQWIRKYKLINLAKVNF